MPSTVLVTGANRGIGLELVRQFAADGVETLACCRDPDAAAELQEVASADERVSVFALDVNQGESVARLKSDLAGRSIDILINNAGVIGGERESQTLGSLDYDTWLDALRTNTLGPLRVSEALLDAVASSHDKKIVTITSQMGSIENNAGGYYAYRSSKAAVNQAMRSLARDAAGRGIVVLLLHPGWVRTDMGGPNAAISATESVRGIRKVIAGAGRRQSGRFFDYSGAELPW